MSYELAIGDRLNSSWSLRGWLLFAKFDIPVSVRMARMYSDAFPEMLSEFAPSKTVPVMKVDDDFVVWESLAMAEFLAERHEGMWPADPEARAFARGVVAEMHAGFMSIRDHCAMNLRVAYSECAAPEDVLADVARLEMLWGMAREKFGADGPWLFGEYSIADVFFAPVAARIAGYGLKVAPVAADYVATHLSDEKFRQWRAMGFAENYEQTVYRRDYPQVAWPGPEVLAAKPTDRKDAENSVCPYSGTGMTDYLEIDGRVFGFCNKFCRDKTVADALAWPKFRDIFEV